jgi:Protein of unknown function DUF2834
MMTSAGRQAFFAALTVAGLLATWYFNLQFMRESGGTFGVIDFVRGGYANNAASSLTNDLLIGTLAFFAFSFAEARRLAMRHWWIYPVLTFTVAFACAFPLFLLVRERRLQVLGQ